MPPNLDFSVTPELDSPGADWKNLLVSLVATTDQDESSEVCRRRLCHPNDGGLENAVGKVQECQTLAVLGQRCPMKNEEDLS